MASGEEEVALEETGTPRTRSTRAVPVKKTARGRKKVAASPRATRSKRSTRSTQPAESEEEEDDDTQTESNQDASENATTESVEESVNEDDNIGDDVVSEDNIPEEDNVVKDDNRVEDGNDSDSGDEVQEEGSIKDEKEQIKNTEKLDGKGDEQDDASSDAKSKSEPQEETKDVCENGHDKSENEHENKIKMEKDNEETDPASKKAGAGNGIKKLEATEESVNIKKENGEESDSNETAEIKQEARLVKQELEELNQPETGALPQQMSEGHSSPVQTVEEKEVPEKMEIESGGNKVESESKPADSKSKTADSKSKTADSKSKTADSKSKTADSKTKTADSKTKTADSKSKTADSKSKTADSKSKTADSKSKTADSKSKTADSKSKTADSKSKPVDSKNKTVESESKIVDSKSKSMESESKKVESESKTVELERKAEVKDEKMEVDEDTTVKGTEETIVKDEMKKESTLQNKAKEKKLKVKEDESMVVVDEKMEETAVEKEIQEDNSNNRATEEVENMTVIDEVTDESAVQEQMAKEDKSNVEGQSPFPTEPDTEMVSEDELPTESSKEPLETEAVSDEELPEPAAPVDLPETEAVSEDELPPEKVEKKKKKKAVPATKVADSSGTGAEGETSKKKVRSTEAQKRKMIDGDTYDPSSPTSENSCDETPAAKRAAVSSATGGVQAKPVTKTRKALPELEKYWKAVKEDPSDFTGWTYLLQYVDQENDIEAAREAYDAFLSHYPYCYGYWRKYADYEKRKGNKEKCEEVFERGLKAIPLSVDLWIHFLNYSKATYPDDEEHLRTQFEKAINACGMEFRSDRLWESYIKWETEGKRLQNVTALYDRLLAMPTQGYTNHFDNFQEHIANNPPQKVLSVDEFLTLRREVLQQLKQYDTPTTADDAVPGEEVEAPPGEEPEEQPLVKTDEETTALRERIISIRRKVHKATVSAVADRWNFEEGIKRPYFHVKPLERCQLKNWKEYLDYEIEQGDQERIVVLFERCLIACALYEEFWIKFVRYLEGIKGEDVADKIRNVYERACTIHHTKKPNLHLHWAVFEESHKNYEKASEILNSLEKLIPNMLQVAYRRINLERRRNNMDKVCTLYEHYISNTKNKVISNNMAIKYARFCWKVKGDVDKAIAILNKAVEKDKENPRLYLQLIDMGLQKSPLNEEEIVSIIDLFLGRDTDPEQKVLFAQRKVEFLEDFGSDIVSVQKAHDEFQRYFKQAKDRKKKSPDLDKSAENASSKKAKSLSTGGDGTPLHSHTSPQTAHSATGQQAAQASATAAASASQYQATTYNQTGGYSQQAQAQGGYQGSQYPPAGPQQPPTPYNQPPYNQQYGQSSDPNYANYQNWGYSQTGYGGYNQGWGNYNYY